MKTLIRLVEIGNPEVQTNVISLSKAKSLIQNTQLPFMGYLDGVTKNIDTTSHFITSMYIVDNFIMAEVETTLNSYGNKLNEALNMKSPVGLIVNYDTYFTVIDYKLY